MNNDELIDRIIIYDEAKCDKCGSKNFHLVDFNSHTFGSSDERARIFRLDGFCDDCHKDTFIPISKKLDLVYHKLPTGDEVIFLKTNNPFEEKDVF
jgi:hypothetical protein